MMLDKVQVKCLENADSKVHEMSGPPCNVWFVMSFPFRIMASFFCFCSSMFEEQNLEEKICKGFVLTKPVFLQAPRFQGLTDFVSH